MKRKLTITLDDDLIPRAKAAARRRGLSLSALIERVLARETEEGEPSFSERWRGKFRPAERDDDRQRALAEKYL